MFHIQQQQSWNNTSINGSSSADLANILTNNSNPTATLINISMVCLTLFGTNGLNLSSTPLLRQMTSKEYCQAKKPNNRFNVSLGTKFYRVRLKSWKPSHRCYSSVPCTFFSSSFFKIELSLATIYVRYFILFSLFLFRNQVSVGFWTFFFSLLFCWIHRGVLRFSFTFLLFTSALSFLMIFCTEWKRSILHN